MTPRAVQIAYERRNPGQVRWQALADGQAIPGASGYAISQSEAHDRAMSRLAQLGFSRSGSRAATPAPAGRSLRGT
jgi:hypothetical protein